MPENIFKSWVIKILAAFSGLTITLIGWFLIRMISVYDQSVQNQDILKQSVNDLKQTAIGISWRIGVLSNTVNYNAKMEEEHYKEVQKLQKKIYNQ